MPANGIFDRLPLEVLARALCRLHPHDLARLQRLSRRAAAAIGVLLSDVLFSVSCLAGHAIDVVPWWQHKDIADPAYVDRTDPPPEPVRAVDFRHLPVSFTIALFMRRGFSLDAINCVAEDHEWDKSSGRLDATLPGNQRVTTAFRHLILQQPDKFHSLGRDSDTCLLWAATVGDYDLTREMVRRVYLDFQNDPKYNRKWLTQSLKAALNGALRGGQQDIIDLLLTRDDVRPDGDSVVLAAALPNADVMRAILARIDSRPHFRAIPHALHDAAHHGNEAVLEVLLVEADVPEMLHQSLFYVESVATCQRLIAAGADPSWSDANVLHDVIYSEQLDLVKFLVSDSRVQRILANNEPVRRRVLQDAAQQGAEHTNMAAESPFDSLPLELLARVLCRLHPHAVAQLRRLSRRAAAAVGVLLPDVPFAVSCLAGLPIDLARRRHDETNDIALSTNVDASDPPPKPIRAVDFRHLPLSFTIALFMREGFSLDAINCVAEDHEWDKSLGHLVAALPGNQRVTAAFQHLIFERPDRLRSWGPAAFCLKWAATIGDVDLTREMVRRVFLDFQNDPKYDPKWLTQSLQAALNGALRSGQQDIIDLLLARHEVRPDNESLVLAAALPNVDVMRTILSRTEPHRSAIPRALHNAADHCNDAVLEVLLAAAGVPDMLHLSLPYVRNVATCQRLIAAGADPSIDARVLFRTLSGKQLDLVEFLLSDPRTHMAAESRFDRLPLEVLARALCRLHPHAVVQLRRLSRRAAAAVGVLLPDVPFAVSCLAGLPIDVARWRHDEPYDIALSTNVDASNPPPEPIRAVDFRHLPVSFTIALFMKSGISLDDINCVAEDQKWAVSSGHLDAALPGYQRVTAAFRHLVFERPDRVRSWRWAFFSLKWAATVGDYELTREMVRRVCLDFQKDPEYDRKWLTHNLKAALNGALRVGQQDIIDLLLARDDVQTDGDSVVLAAALPNVDVMRAILARIDSRPHFRAVPHALHDAAHHGNEAVLEVLLVKADDPEILHQSLLYVESVATCQRLIAAGADPSWNDANVLHDVIYSKQLDLVKFLVSDSRVQRILANNETLRREFLQDAVQQGADYLEPFLVGNIVTLKDAEILLRGWPSWSPPEDVASQLRSYVAEANK
ncbi:hypothetical protein HK405_013517 [Cladochytrium tenue]|nr:hypothetical protein HK405_013517 [Cladochytrium tenue]